MTASEQALAKQDVVVEPEIIRTRQQFHGYLNRWHQQECHILTPAADFAALPPQWGLLPVKVQIDTTQESREVYHDKLFCDADEVALSKIGLSRIMQAAGMSCDTQRTDPRTISNYWEFKATVTVIGLDGTRKSWSASHTLDLRDGADQALKAMGKNKSSSALSAARVHGPRLCETKAINAAVRQFGVGQKYSLRELEKPFVVLLMRFEPDWSDPTQAAIATQMALGGSSALYSSTPLPALPPAADVDAIDAAPAKTERQAKPSTQTAPPPLKVTDVTHSMETGLYTIAFSNKTTAVTDQRDVLLAAQKAQKAGQVVEVDTEKRDGATHVSELRVAPAQPAATGTTTKADDSSKETLPDGSSTIVKVEKFDGPQKDDDSRPWRRYDVTLANGLQVSTFFWKFQKVIDDAEKRGARVRIESAEPEGTYLGKIESIEIVDARQQSLPNPGDL